MKTAHEGAETRLILTKKENKELEKLALKIYAAKKVATQTEAYALVYLLTSAISYAVVMHECSERSKAAYEKKRLSAKGVGEK
jgi:hypothetical protein